MITTERKKALLSKMMRLDGYREVRNLIGRAALAFNNHDADQILEYFALEDQDVWVEYADEGLFVGKEAVECIIKEIFGEPGKPGELMDIYLTTPIVEIAEDGKTARGVWWCPLPMVDAAAGTEPQAIWAWGNIGVDFINTNGEWKIWHFHYFRVFKCRYELGWVDDLSMVNRMNTAANPMAQPPTYHNPYTPLSVRDGIPAPPRPYKEHKEDSGWMLNTRKDR